MEMLYTDHASEKIAERKIAKELIEDTLLHPTAVIESRFGRKIAQKIVKNKLLRIVYSMERDAYLIITVYFTTAERYKVGK